MEANENIPKLLINKALIMLKSNELTYKPDIFYILAIVLIAIDKLIFFIKFSMKIYFHLIWKIMKIL